MTHYSLATVDDKKNVNHDEHEREYLLTWLTTELAATICGSKPSTILTLTDTKQQPLFTLWKRYGGQILDNTLIECMSLRSYTDKETVLFYRPEMLEKCITNVHHKKFLQHLGYKVDEGLTSCLALLKKRFQDCCPHEMGVLLGIPLKDVLGFMSMTNLPQTCRKEWCIYGNPEVSLSIIRKFDEDRSMVSCMLADGITPHEIMCGKVLSSNIA